MGYVAPEAGTEVAIGIALDARPSALTLAGCLPLSEASQVEGLPESDDDRHSPADWRI